MVHIIICFFFILLEYIIIFSYAVTAGRVHLLYRLQLDREDTG